MQAQPRCEAGCTVQRTPILRWEASPSPVRIGILRYSSFCMALSISESSRGDSPSCLVCVLVSTEFCRFSTRAHGSATLTGDPPPRGSALGAAAAGAAAPGAARETRVETARTSETTRGPTTRCTVTQHSTVWAHIVRLDRILSIHATQLHLRATQPQGSVYVSIFISPAFSFTSESSGKMYVRTAPYPFTGCQAVGVAPISHQERLALHHAPCRAALGLTPSPGVQWLGLRPASKRRLGVRGKRDQAGGPRQLPLLVRLAPAGVACPMRCQ